MCVWVYASPLKLNMDRDEGGIWSGASGGMNNSLKFNNPKTIRDLANGDAPLQELHANYQQHASYGKRAKQALACAQRLEFGRVAP